MESRGGHGGVVVVVVDVGGGGRGRGGQRELVDSGDGDDAVSAVVVPCHTQNLYNDKTFI